MLSYIQKTHNKDRSKDRYRTVFCDESFYRTHQAVFKLWRERFADFLPAEKLLSWTIGLSCLRRDQDWFGGIRERALLENTAGLQHPLSLRQLFMDTGIRTPTKLNAEMNLSDFVSTVKIKALPDSCLRSLCFMLSGRYPLVITDQVPTPSELLHLQIAGQRVVSFNENFEAWPGALFSERDFLGFVLHDLIHADHFFYEPQHTDGQRGFYRLVQGFLRHPELTERMRIENFRAGFEYIISDMNSHPVHLLQTLHSILFSNVKNDELALSIWRSWFEFSEFSADEFKALNQINTTEFNGASARLLEILCIKLGQSASQAMNIR